MFVSVIVSNIIIDYETISKEPAGGGHPPRPIPADGERATYSLCTGSGLFTPENVGVPVVAMDGPNPTVSGPAATLPMNS